MYRTHNCGELRSSHIGNEVTLAGWVQTVRKFGSITFIDLRDRYGVTQLFFSEKMNGALDAKPLGREYVIQVKGRVVERTNKNVKMPTGDVEIEVTALDILNAAATPPFTIEEESDGGDELRMKYRYLDLRRPPLKRNLELRYKVNRSVRNYLGAQGFWDIETPFLIRSTPEGARDFVVPSRMNEGQFYALPQSPQTFKQLLMVSGYDRYYQIVKCFRDEDLRADRQPEFTQIDCEMSFVEQEDILNMFEGLFKHVFKDVKGIDITEAFPRMTFADAMWHYGNDKPDLRFEMKIQNAKAVNEVHCAALNGVDFKVFNDAETVLMIAVPGAAEYTRKQLDELTEWVKRPQIGMSGVVNIKCNADGTHKSSVDKFFNEEKLKEIGAFCGAKAGDLVLILAGAETRTRKAMSELRLEMGNRLGLRNNEVYKPLWVIDFPLFELDEENNRWVARHHPFTSPKPEHIALMDDLSRYGEINANAYDMVLNGTEIGGGSIRIFRRDLQEKMFAALGMSKEEAQDKFGFLMGAFEYGAPPHGGLALGFDRLCALLGGQEGIRDFIAFPKNNAGRDVMLDAPGAIDDAQKRELGLDAKKSAIRKVCYHCGIPLSKENFSVEHVPAKNLYDDFDNEFKKNRITVTACKTCNGLFSKIDQEIRDVLAIKNQDINKKKELTRKGVKSILLRPNWKGRLYTDSNGNVHAVDFSYEDLRSLHIKNFMALFFRKYGCTVPNNFIIEIIADGDEKLIKTAQILYNYIRTDKDWEISGHEDVFKFILKDITPNEENGIIYESGNFGKLVGVAGLLVYHDDIGVIIVASKKDFIETCKPK